MTNQNLYSLSRLVAGLCLALLPLSSFGIINFGLDNSGNTTDPGTGVPWDAVARVANYDGSSVTSPEGSGVHLGFGYVLTANHVDVNNDTWVSFDGTNWLQRDTSFAAQQVAPNVDMQIFKLQSTPTTASVAVYDGIAEQIAPATLVGWGRGRNPLTPVDSTSVPWGNNATINKRWGNNVPRDVATLLYQTGSYQAIRTVVGSATGTPPGLGDNEVAATLYDSGSGLFQFLSGRWYLIGITTAVETSGTSNFGDDVIAVGGDENYFARVSTYHDAIDGIIPETRNFALCFALLGVALVSSQRRFVRSGDGYNRR